MEDTSSRADIRGSTTRQGELKKRSKFEVDQRINCVKPSLSPQCFKSSKLKLVVVCRSLVLWCYRIEPDAWFFTPSRSSSCKAPSFKPSKPQVSRFWSSRSQAAVRLLAESGAPGTHSHGNENSEESGGGRKGTGACTATVHWPCTGGEIRGGVEVGSRAGVGVLPAGGGPFRIVYGYLPPQLNFWHQNRLWRYACHYGARSNSGGMARLVGLVPD
ncbi:hypothetical protein B0H13DRAFT_1851929 [Mycena leptocephala]|nr:hypothetical protein B0H13DRAFT_1851929 [Mycena leptocephala]